jgi:L-threonylcarbamoyladenylate synthase
VAEIGKDIDKAAELLSDGKLVAIPTETVYGLAANALNEKAVLSIFEAKERPFFDPLIIHVPSIDAAKQYAHFRDLRLLKLAQSFWPGPLTLLLPKKSNIPDLVTSGLEQVAVRVPNHSLSLQLLEKINFPLAAPSANPFGYVSPTEPEHVQKQLGAKIDYILDGGSCAVGIESTIVGIEEGNVCVYRLGGLAIEELERCIGPIELRINNSSNPKAPGQLKNHYAPKKPLFIGNVNELLNTHASKKVAIICFGQAPNTSQTYLYNLSETKNYKEAAINLFKYLRLADESVADIVICEKLPDVDLGRAINDRLRRAAG